LDVIEGRGGGCWGVYVITCLVVYVANIPTGGRGMDWDGVLVYGGRGGGGFNMVAQGEIGMSRQGV